MPVILAPEDYDRWLDPEAADGRALLRPCPPERAEAYPVSTRVNNPGTTSPDSSYRFRMICSLTRLAATSEIGCGL